MQSLLQTVGDEPKTEKEEPHSRSGSNKCGKLEGKDRIKGHLFVCKWADQQSCLTKPCTQSPKSVLSSIKLYFLYDFAFYSMIVCNLLNFELY